MPLVERHFPADFRYKGNRRKRKLLLSPRHAEGHSLDSFKQLATSEKKQLHPVTASEFLRSQTNARDRHRRAWVLYLGLLSTIKRLSYAESNVKWLEAVYEVTGKAAMKRRRKSRQWTATRDFERLSGCGTEWIGFRPQCCNGRAVAVPIGCNHRLCPLCNNRRAERYRKRVQALFHELSNPQLLTLTVPSPRKMTRAVIDTLRTRLKAFLKQESALLKGGVYSIEITYNRREKTWHPHVHVLVDVADPRVKLPWREFVERKWRLEFDWFLLTQGKREMRRWKNADFTEWCGGLDSAGRLRGPGRGNHRRVCDLRPVTKDRKAAYEVLKYMSKAATFIGEEEALKELLVAIRGIRQIQTFGTCYGFKIDDEGPVESHLECECGKRDFKPIGRLGLGTVEMSLDGTWYVRDDAPVHGRRCRDGTHRGRRKR